MLMDFSIINKKRTSGNFARLPAAIQITEFVEIIKQLIQF